MTHDELIKGPFTASDFDLHKDKRTRVMCSKHAAEQANAKFHKLLGAKVYGRVFTEKDSMGHLHYWHSEPGDKDHDKFAYLIGAFPIESEEDERISHEETHGEPREI